MKHILIVLSVIFLSFSTKYTPAAPPPSQYDLNVAWLRDILDARLRNQLKFRGNFCRGGVGGSRFNQLVSAQGCYIPMSAFPGSEVSCVFCSGKWVSGSHTAIFAQGGIMVRHIFILGQVIIESSFPPVLDPEYATFRIYDSGDNYILFKLWKTKKHLNYKVLDAHLPDDFKSAILTHVKKLKTSVNIQKNDLVSIINAEYPKYEEIDLYHFCLEILSDLHTRKTFIKNFIN